MNEGMTYFAVLLIGKTDYLICFDVSYTVEWWQTHQQVLKKCLFNENRNYLTSKSILFFDLLDVVREK